MSAIIPLALELPDDTLVDAYHRSSRFRKFGRMELRQLDPTDLAAFRDWWETSFQTENLNSEPDFAFMVASPGAAGEAHIDILKGDHKDGRGRRLHVKLASINKTLSPKSGHFEYMDEDGKVISAHDEDGFAIYQTDTLHRGNNKSSTLPRVLFTIGLFKDSYNKLALLHRTGRLLRQ